MTSRLHLLLLPHEKNNHRAFLLQPAFLGLIIALYVFNQSLLRTITLIKPGVLGYASEITTAKVLQFINAERQTAGLPALRSNSTLNNSAIAKANDMFSQNYWAHNSPSGLTPWTFFRQAGYQYSVAGENLAKDFYDTDSMVTAWMNSSTHRANIVNSKYQETGIAVVNGTLNGLQTTLVVQHFGTPIVTALPKKEVAKPVAPITTAAPAVLEVVQPEETAANPVAGGQVLARGQIPSITPVSPVAISKAFGAILFILILGVLIADAYHTLKKHPYRLAGSSAGHISFLAIIFLLMLFARQGSIF